MDVGTRGGEGGEGVRGRGIADEREGEVGWVAGELRYEFEAEAAGSACNCVGCH